MFLRIGFLAIIVSAVVPSPVLAQDVGFFAGLDVSGGVAHGSSSTKDGGAPFAGGGVVNNLEFGKTVGVGGHIGYQFDTALSIFLSYQHIRGDIRWDADFPMVGAASSYAGKAISNVILGNAAYEMPLSDATALKLSVGLGVTLNSLSGIRETDKGTGIFLSDVKNHTEAGPAAQLGAGIWHKVTPNVVLGLDVATAYAGGFRTGDTRTGNLGVTEIKPYKIDNVWRTNLTASVQIKF
jgi:hypothetical protein